VGSLFLVSEHNLLNNYFRVWRCSSYLCCHRFSSLFGKNDDKDSKLKIKLEMLRKEIAERKNSKKTN